MDKKQENNVLSKHQQWAESIAMMLKELRKYHNLNQTEVKGMSRRQVQRCENLNENLTLKTFFNACYHLDCHPCDVFEVLR